MTVLHNYFWSEFVLNVYKFITFATVCKYGAKTCIHLLCFTGKCGAKTSFDVRADMAKVKQTWHLLHICYPCKHRVNAVFTIFALFVNVVQRRHLMYVQIWPK